MKRHEIRSMPIADLHPASYNPRTISDDALSLFMLEFLNLQLGLFLVAAILRNSKEISNPSDKVHRDGTSFWPPHP